MSSTLPSIAVLIATYNGGRYLDEQLRSIEHQQGVGQLDVHASDDGSIDGTNDILLKWASRWQRGTFSIARGPQQGFAANFRSLAVGLSSDIQYVACSDQDDFWHADKLEAAIRMLGAPNSPPSVYFSRTRLVDTDGKFIGFSAPFRRPPSFRNALVQSVGGGNTMVLNQAGWNLFAESARRTSFVTHDWWSYLLVSGAGGRAFYDIAAHIDYRQHETNLVGQNTGLKAQMARMRMLLDGQLAAWTDINLGGLEKCSDLLDPSSLELVAAMKTLRAKRGVPALIELGRLRLHRQTTSGNIGLALAAALGKI